MALSAWESGRSGSLTALTWASDAPLVAVMDPAIPGLMARQCPEPGRFGNVAHLPLGADYRQRSLPRRAARRIFFTCFGALARARCADLLTLRRSFLTGFGAISHHRIPITPFRIPNAHPGSRSPTSLPGGPCSFNGARSSHYSSGLPASRVVNAIRTPTHPPACGRTSDEFVQRITGSRGCCTASSSPIRSQAIGVSWSRRGCCT